LVLLVPGCAFQPTGSITGTPTTKGKYTVVVKAKDSSKPKGKVATLDVTITIS